MNQKKFKDKLKQKQYEQCNAMLKDEIIHYFEHQIQKQYQEYQYQGMLNLLEKANQYLSKENVILLKRFYVIMNKECIPSYETEVLMNMYQEIWKG